MDRVPLLGGSLKTPNGRKRLLVCLIVTVVMIGLGIGILFICMSQNPIVGVIINNNQSGNETYSFTWDDDVSLYVDIVQGLHGIIFYKWEMVPVNGSSYSSREQSGKTLEFTANDEFYFEINEITVKISYLGKWFSRTYSYQINNYQLSNNSMVIQDSQVISFSNTQLILNGTDFSVITKGYSLISSEGSYLLQVISIISSDSPIYTYQIQQGSISNLFKYLNVNGGFSIQSSDSSGDIVSSSENSLAPDSSSTSNLKQLLTEGSGSSSEEGNEFSFHPFKSGLGDLKLIFGGSNSFDMDTSSDISITCQQPNLATSILSNNLNSQSYQVTCTFNIEILADLYINANTNFEYTYYLYGGSNDEELENETFDLSNNSSIAIQSLRGGLLSKGKVFEVLWKSLSKGMKYVFKQFIEFKVPLKFKVNTDTDIGLTIKNQLTSTLTFAYSYTSDGNIQISPVEPINWNGVIASTSDLSIGSCNCHIDISIGLGIYHSFMLDFAEVGVEFLLHLPWYDSFPYGYTGNIHGIEQPYKCQTGQRPEATTTGFSVGFDIGLEFWKFGISKSWQHDFGLYLNSFYCSQAQCSIPYIMYTCNNNWGVYSCIENPNGTIQGYATCQSQCKAPPQVCTACPNTNCCNCYNPPKYPCSASCSFTCPGDFNACCMPQ